MKSTTRKPAFPSAFDWELGTPITLVELRMRQLSGRIQAKPRWWEKVYDDAIVAKWRTEIVEQDRALVETLWGGEERFNDEIERNRDADSADEDSEDGRDGQTLPAGPKKWPRDPITDAQLDYIFAALRHAASERDSESGIFVSLSSSCSS